MSAPDKFLGTARARFNQMRLGQHMMNELSIYRPDLYKKIMHTEADCFYDDKKIPAFEAFVAESWHDATHPRT